MAKKIIKIISLILVGIVLGVGITIGALQFYIYSCIYGLPSYIRNGFSEEMTENLSSYHGLSVPEGSKFIDGEYRSNMQGNQMYILFEIDVSEYPKIKQHEKAINSLVSNELYSKSNMKARDVGYDKIIDQYTKKCGHEFVYVYERIISHEELNALLTTEIVDGKMYCIFYSDCPNKFIS